MDRPLIRLSIFVALTYSITILYDTLLGYAYGYKLQATPAILLVIRNFIPLAATVATVAMLGEGVKLRLRDYGVRGCKIRYLLLSGLIPFAIYGFGVAYALTAGFNVVNPLAPLYRDYGRELPKGGEGMILALSLLSTFFIGSTLIALIMFGQEVGWRGLMLTELTSITRSKLLVNVIIGVAWGLWYAPLVVLYGYYYPNHRDIVGISMMVLASICLNDVLVRVRMKFDSVLAPSAVMGVLIGLYNLMVYTVVVNDELYSIPYGLLGIASMATFSAILSTLRYYLAK